MSEPGLRLRSYRLAFELERRIHRVDRFRIPVPYGLALSTVGWWAGCLVVVLMAARLPLVGPALAVLPVPIRLLLVPAALAHLLCRRGRDGRPNHEAWVAFLVRRARPARLVAFEAPGERGETRLRDVELVPDERRSTLVPGRVRGAGAVVLAQAMSGSRRGRRTTLTARDVWLVEPQRLDVVPGDRLELRCARR